MVFGFMNPVNLVLSMLLMQGISLSMFRNIVNQTIRRNDNPLKWSVSFGNVNKTLSSSSPESERSTESLTTSTPTLSPLVDPRLMDVVNLLRVLGAQHFASQSASQPQSAQLTMPQTHQPLIALPVQASQPVSRSPSPQIIIVPQLLKQSPSDNVELISKPPITIIESETKNVETFAPEVTRSWSLQEDKILKKIFRNKSRKHFRKHFKNSKPKNVEDIKKAPNHRYEDFLENNPTDESFHYEKDVLGHLEQKKNKQNFL